jgi:hypothetical protein
VRGKEREVNNGRERRRERGEKKRGRESEKEGEGGGERLGGIKEKDRSIRDHVDYFLSICINPQGCDFRNWHLHLNTRYVA